jgi:uncharacterized protein (TIGR03435 family)
VASIKPMKSVPDRIFFRMTPGGGFSGNAVTVKFLIEEAYNIKDAQLVGAPSWTDTERYDIEAKPDDATGAALDKLTPEQRRDQLRLMLQNLLKDRFQLVVTHDSKELPVYALVVAKTGPKVKPSTFNPAEHSADAPRAPGVGGPAGPGIMMNGRGSLKVTYADMSQLANVLSRFAGRPVVDKTGLTAKYDFELKWTPDDTMPTGPSTGPRPPGDDAPPPEATGPSLFTALQEQLGLKLEPQKNAMDVLVIQHVERPSEN